MENGPMVIVLQAVICNPATPTGLVEKACHALAELTGEDEKLAALNANASSEAA
jgi:hypothetical protein